MHNYIRSNISFGLGQQDTEGEQRPVVEARNELRVPLKEIVEPSRRLLLPDFAELPVVVLEVAPVAIFALSCQEEGLAVLRSEVRVELAILEELFQSVGEPTLRSVGTAS